MIDRKDLFDDKSVREFMTKERNKDKRHEVKEGVEQLLEELGLEISCSDWDYNLEVSNIELANQLERDINELCPYIKVRTEITENNILKLHIIV